jgi:hypothetical protein
VIVRPWIALALAGCGAAPPTSGAIGNIGQPHATIGDATLAMFVPVTRDAGGRCELQRVDPLENASEVLATFAGDCLGARIGWRADLARAIVWFDPGTRADGDSDAEIHERWFDVDIATHRASPLQPPYDAREVAYNGSDIVAFTLHEFPGANGTTVAYLGHTLDFTTFQDGIPAAAVAHRRVGTDWQIIDITATTTGWDLAMDWMASPSARTLGPRSVALLEAHHELGEIADLDTKASLFGIAHSLPDGDGWGALPTKYGPLYVWQSVGEFAYTTARIAWARGASVAILPELGDAAAFVAIAVRGRYALVVGSAAGTRARLYDLAEHRLAYRAPDVARPTTLWPVPASARSK